MKTPLNIKIQRIIPRDEFKSFVEKKKQLESVHHPCIYRDLVSNRSATNPPQVSIIIHPFPFLPLSSTISCPSRDTEWMAQKASSSKKLAASNDRPNTEIRFILSLSLVASTVFFSPTCERLASFHGLYLSSRIISFVSLLRQPFPNRTTTSNPSYLPYR